MIYHIPPVITCNDILHAMIVEFVKMCSYVMLLGCDTFMLRRLKVAETVAYTLIYIYIYIYTWMYILYACLLYMHIKHICIIMSLSSTYYLLIVT